MQNEITHNARINYDWLYQLIKEEKVNVFTINYMGDIKSTKINEFKFIKNISRTCKISQGDDHRILDKNKFNIINVLLSANGYNCEELSLIRQHYNTTNNIGFREWLQKKDSSPREMLLGRIISCISTLNIINDVLDIKGEKFRLTRSNKHLFSVLGLFKIIGSSTGSVTIFEDKFRIAGYFPGYIRNREFWDSLKGRSIANSTLKKLINNEIKIDKIGTLEIEKNRNKKEIIREK